MVYPISGLSAKRLNALLLEDKQNSNRRCDRLVNNKVYAEWAEDVESRMYAYNHCEIKASPVEDVFERHSK